MLRGVADLRQTAIELSLQIVGLRNLERQRVADGWTEDTSSELVDLRGFLRDLEARLDRIISPATENPS